MYIYLYTHGIYIHILTHTHIYYTYLYTIYCIYIYTHIYTVHIYIYIYIFSCVQGPFSSLTDVNLNTHYRAKTCAYEYLNFSPSISNAWTLTSSAACAVGATHPTICAPGGPESVVFHRVCRVFTSEDDTTRADSLTGSEQVFWDRRVEAI